MYILDLHGNKVMMYATHPFLSLSFFPFFPPPLFMTESGRSGPRLGRKHVFATERDELN